MKLKNILFLFVLTSVALQITAQEQKRKGYIGISVGPSIPIGEFKEEGWANTGANLSLINFGYLFNNRVGIAANWFGGAHAVDVSQFGLADGMWSYGGLLAGPLVSTPIGSNVDFDARVQIGFSAANLKLDGYNLDGSGFAYSAGIGIRTHLGEKWSLNFNADVLTAKNTGDYMDRKIQAINPTIGVSYRLK